MKTGARVRLYDYLLSFSSHIYMTTQKTMWGKRLLMFSFFLGLAISLDLLVQMLQFDVRCMSLILRNVLHTHNMYFRSMENFLETSEVQKIHEKQHFYNFLGTFKFSLEWVSNYKKHYSFVFSSQKLFLCMLLAKNNLQRNFETK